MPTHPFATWLPLFRCRRLALRALFIAFVPCIGCGRTDINDDYSFDGSASHLDGSVDAAVMDANGQDARDGSSDTGPSCGPSTCKSCCQPNGLCVQNSDLLCGTNGQQCEVCPPTFHCVKNPYCIKDVPNCGPMNCEGCCWAGGGNGPPSYCVSGLNNSLCGHGGEVCLACDTTNGMKCGVVLNGKGGSCTGKPIQCSSSNCSGCCYGNICATGAQDIACGVNGNACVDCSAQSKTCQAHQCK